MSMNRQLRRAQDKQDKKLEKEKQERRAERRKRLDQLRAQRKRKTTAKPAADKAGNKDSATPAPAKPGRGDPGRFSGALAIATVAFIVLQAVVPTETEGTFDSVIKAGFYLMLGYFLTLWLLRRQQPNALILTGLAGMILLTGTWLGFLLRPDAPLDGLSMLLSLPLLLVGIWLGRLVYNMAQSQMQR